MPVGIGFGSYVYHNHFIIQVGIGYGKKQGCFSAHRMSQYYWILKLMLPDEVTYIFSHDRVRKIITMWGIAMIALVYQKHLISLICQRFPKGLPIV
jgi:hypothetical protein